MGRFKRHMPHPLDGIVPTPTKEEADKIMSNLPVTKKDIPKFNKMLKSMGKTKKKKTPSRKPYNSMIKRMYGTS